MRQRTSLLHQYINSISSQPLESNTDLFQHLSSSLEEMHVAQEEIQQQQKELSATRRQLEIEHQRYRDLFEFAPDAYLVTNLEGIVLEANQAAEALFNRPKVGLKGNPLVIFVPHEMRRGFRLALLQMQQLQRMQDWELQMQPKERDPIDVVLTVQVVSEPEDQTATLRWLVRDVTERKRADEQLRQMQLQNIQMAEGLRLKSQFLAVLSHELRTPMNSIIGFSELLMRKAQPPLVPQHASMVERILRNARNLMSMINTILDFSQIDSDRLELKVEEIDLPDLVQDTIESLNSLSQQKNLNLSADVSLSNPIITNDRIRLEQILVNLLSNAIKFTEQGSVRLEVYELPSERLAIAVRDTGIGIPLEHQSDIFQEFRQINQTLSRSQSGTGLGLAIVNRLVRLMGGTITVQSQVHSGSVFQVNIPRRVI